MKAHTNNYKNLIKEQGREIDALITYEDNGDLVELGTEQLNSITLSYDGDILKSVMKQLVLDSNVNIPNGTILNYKFGLKVGNSYEYLDYGNFIVYSSDKKEDVNSYEIICYDKLLYSMKDYEQMNITYPITLKNYLIAVCNKIGLTFNNTNFVNQDCNILEELYLTSRGESLGYKFRDVLDEIAQASASTICINDDDELEVRYITNTNDTIDESYFKDNNVNFGKMLDPINVVVFSRSDGTDNIMYPETPPENPHEIKIRDNQILNGNNRDDFILGVYNQLNGLTYCINEYVSTGITYYDLCDRYNVQIGENTYSCVMLNDEMIVQSGLSENIYTYEPPIVITDYSKADKTDRRINQTYLIVDKQNQQINALVGRVDEQDSSIAQIMIDYQHILSELENVSDLTTSGESSGGSVTLSDKVIESNPIEVKIHPVVENISYLYPSDNLYPSDLLFPKSRTLRFTNIDTDEIFDYVLPTDLWKYDNTTYDDLNILYKNGEDAEVIVNRRCKINADGSISPLDTPTTETYPYPDINLTSGHYVVSLVGYTDGYLFVRLLAENIYTEQYYTKAQTNTLVNQTAMGIEASVSATLEGYDDSQTIDGKLALKLGKNEYGELISMLNASADEITLAGGSKINLTTAGQLLISAGNFQLDQQGNITCQDAQLDDVTIDGGSINLISADAYEDTFKIVDTTGTQFQTFNAFMHNAEYHPNNSNDRSWFYTTANQSFCMLDMARINYTDNYDDRVTINIEAGQPEIRIESTDLNNNNSNTTDIFSNEIRTTGDIWGHLHDTSLEENKKNIKPYKKNALDIIKDIDIYSYNYKNEDDKNKKHIGFVIGDKYNYSKEITSNENEGVDLYSFISVCCKAIQEQQKEINLLKEEIRKMKESDK